MKKIPTLFVRDPEDRAHVTDEVTPGCEWVLAGEGVATRKYDGTCVMLDDAGKWWARREVKPGKLIPQNYVVVGSDEVTSKLQGWEPIEQGPFAKFHAEAISGWHFTPGTYELIGPKIQGNPEKYENHVVKSHAHAETLPLLSCDVLFVKMFVSNLGKSGWEGIVWHHPDGRMAKLKARDLKGDAMKEKLTNDEVKESVASWMALAHNQDELVTNRQFDDWLESVRQEAADYGWKKGREVTQAQQKNGGHNE